MHKFRIFDASVSSTAFQFLASYHYYQILSWLHAILLKGLTCQGLGLATPQRVSVSAASPAKFVFPMGFVLHNMVKSTAVLVQTPHILRLSAQSSAQLVFP